MTFTKRNHYNPCFWTAHWNAEYHRVAVAGAQTSAARTQRVHELSVKSDKVFESTVENVHYDKHLGVAEITREAAEDFVRRNHPDKHEGFMRANVDAPYPVSIDFEEILGALEQMPPYQMLLDVVQEVEAEELAAP